MEYDPLIPFKRSGLQLCLSELRGRLHCQPFLFANHGFKKKCIIGNERILWHSRRTKFKSEPSRYDTPGGNDERRAATNSSK